MDSITAPSIDSDARRLLTKITMSLLLLVLLGNLGALTTRAAFSSATANNGNTFQAGTVQLTDNDAEGTVLSLATAKPGDSSTGCIQVTYSGTLPAAVRLYGATTAGTGLNQYLDVTITRGSFSGATPAAGSCAGFVADSATYQGANGVLFNGRLNTYPGGWAAGIADPDATWSTGKTVVYRFQATLADINAAQGLGHTQTFTWEARS